MPVGRRDLGQLEVEKQFEEVVATHARDKHDLPFSLCCHPGQKVAR